MKILMVADFYLPHIGGAERAVADLCRELRRRGHAVLVATMWQEDLTSYEELDGIPVHRLHGLARHLPLLHARPRQRYHPPVPDPLVTAALARLIARERPDVVHGHSWMLFSALPVCRAHRVATVATLHDYALLCPKKTLLHEFHDEAHPCVEGLGWSCPRCTAAMYGGPRAALASAALAAGRGGIRHVDRFIAISAHIAMAHTRGGLLPASRVVTIPNFVRDDVLGTPRQPRLPGLPDEYILFVGALGRHKGLRFLLDAYARLDPNIPLVLAGPARPDTPSVFPRGVIAPGPLPHDAVIAALGHCRFLVQPALWPEPFGLVLIEAMARGKAVVASRAGGPMEIVRDGDTGLLVAPNATEALAAAMRLLLGDAGLAERMGRAGAAHCAASFSAGRVVPRVEGVYAAAHRARQRRQGLSIVSPGR